MRTVIADFLDERMASDQKIIMFDADLAKANGTYKLIENYPDRALDLGIAEANMVCMAAGLASYGYKPFVFSFCPFVTRRVADQVAISVAYSGMNVKIVGTDPGIAAQLNGATHLSVEDVGVIRSIPGLVIFEPVDCSQYRQALPTLLEYDGPVYIRQLRKTTPKEIFTDSSYKFDLFKADILQSGTDVTLFATGIEVEQAMDAAERLAKQGIGAEVINVHTIKPLDLETIAASIKKTRCAVICENHNIIGGLGSGIAEALAQLDPVPLELIGIQDRFGEVGELPYLIRAFQMDADSVLKAALKVLKRKENQ
ncbi:MAG TPA: transketolase C-terminal domain-containing protein [Anaerovoracaceae bacterium]|nr:transketolase C-terminal domain-containing protein [Anaerovoracaceae bacterium]